MHIVIFLLVVSLALRENTYPYLALIVLRDNKMTVVQRIEGPVQPVDLVERLTRVMNDTESYLVTMRHEREQRNLANTLRQQQDVAYEESLRQDQEKVRTDIQFVPTNLTVHLYI